MYKILRQYYGQAAYLTPAFDSIKFDLISIHHKNIKKLEIFTNNRALKSDKL